MDNKVLGGLILAFIGVIVALALLTGGITAGVGQLTTTSTITNETVTLPASGSYIDRADCINYGGTPIVTNATSGAVVPNTNYTFTTRVSPTNGLKVLTIKSTGGVFASTSINASYTCLPQGYAEDSAARSMTSLIILLSILALIAFVLFFAYKNLGGVI